MIGLPPGAHVWLAAGVTDMRNGFDGLAAIVKTALSEDPFSSHLFVFPGRQGELVSLCILPLKARELQRSILSVFREVTWPTRHDFPQAYRYRG